jgi:hypothetical protein
MNEIFISYPPTWADVITMFIFIILSIITPIVVTYIDYKMTYHNTGLKDAPKLPKQTSSNRKTLCEIKLSRKL